MRKVDTPTQKTCEDVAALMGIDLNRTVKSVALMGVDARGLPPQFVLALVRGDHVVNEIKLAKLAGLGEYRLATEGEIDKHLGSEPGFLGPVAPKQGDPRHRRPQRRRDGRLRRRRQRKGLPPRRRQLGPRPARAATTSPTSATWSKAIRRPMASGTLGIARGIEVGHVFQLGRKYAEAMKLHRARRDRQGRDAG